MLTMRDVKAPRKLLEIKDRNQESIDPKARVYPNRNVPSSFAWLADHGKLMQRVDEIFPEIYQNNLIKY